MDKKLKLIGTFLLLSIFISCVQNPNSNSGSGINTSISTTNDGVEITINNSGYNWEIYRYDNINNRDDAYISGNKVINGKLKDIYVEPGHSYSYYISFYDSNWNKISNQEFPEVKPTNGKGKLSFANKPAAKYDADGNMTFLVKPSISAEDEKFLGKDNISYQFYYRHFPDGGYQGRVGGGFNIFINSNGKQSQNIFVNDGYEVEGKSMVLIDLSGICVNYDDISYEQYYSHEELPDMPNSVTFHDNRPKITFGETTEGVKIEIPSLNVEGTKRISIDRRNPETGVWDWFDVRNLNTTSVIDYFVESGKDYEYRLRYRDDQGYDIITTDFFKVKANGGKGPITLQQNPVVKYDANTGIMNFTTLPKLNNEYENSFTNSNIKFFICYGKNKHGWEVMCPIVEESIDCRQSFHDHSLDYLGKNIYLISFFVDMITEDNVLYRFELPLNLIPEELHTIVVPK